MKNKNYKYSGLCLKWVDDQLGNTNRQPTAYADYLERKNKGLIINSLKNIPDGARVYFAPSPSNKNLGHIGIYNAKTKTFTSATENGIETYTIDGWEKLTNQKFLGWSTK